MYGSEARMATKTPAWRLAASDTRPLRKNPLDPTSTNRDVRVEQNNAFFRFPYTGRFLLVTNFRTTQWDIKRSQHIFVCNCIKNQRILMHFYCYI